MTKVFVYGTLKRGYGNNHLLADAKFIGTGETVALCRLFDAGFPVLRQRSKRPGAWNAPVTGEVYEVNDAELARLDSLESEGRMYHRREKKIRMANGEVIKAFVYVGSAEFWRERIPLYPAPDGAYTWQRGTPSWQHSGQYSSA